MATNKQRSHFFGVWGKAKAEICERYDLCSRIRDQERAARHRWVMECTSRTEDINAVRPGNEFSRLMLQTAIAAGDYREASYWEMDIAKRWRWFMEQLLRQIGEITKSDRPWEYVQGIFAHMRFPTLWEDIPEGELEKVWQMLDTHRRRLLKRDHGWTSVLSFVPCAEFYYSSGTLRVKWPKKIVSGEDMETSDVESLEDVKA